MSQPPDADESARCHVDRASFVVHWRLLGPFETDKNWSRPEYIPAVRGETYYNLCIRY